MDEILVTLIPPRRRVSFLLGGAVSSSMLRVDSETECLLEDVVEDGLDDDDRFFLVKRLVVFFHMIAKLFSLLYFHVSTGDYVLQKLLRNVDFEWIKGVNCLSNQAQEGWLCLQWFWAQKLEHTNK
jgi:hypothetical protein